MTLLWDRGTPTDPIVLGFSAGEEHLLDDRLVPFDCTASIAHARMLAAGGMLSARELRQLIRGLERIAELHSAGEFHISPEQEDCHTAIEEWLVENIGEAGKKIHLGRSRNDQVLTALRLYERNALSDTARLMASYRAAILEAAAPLEEVTMPGYTHMRPAMPTSAATWLRSFAGIVSDDLMLLETIGTLVNRSPLGTGAGYGVPLPGLDREVTASELGFESVQENPVHTHACRGREESLILSALVSVAQGLNRLAADLLLFSMPAFGFVRLPDGLCTGSSMMPQKRNPDVLELVRGAYHTVLSCEMRARSLSGNLMSGYQRDLGLTKKPLFEGFDTLCACLRVMEHVMRRIRVDAEACARALTPEIHATSQAYRLALEGLAFRDAYRMVARGHSRPPREAGDG